MILGFYEKEIVHLVCELGDGEKVLVDLGAAEGFYAVGALVSKRFSRTVCFESNPSISEALLMTAERNGVRALLSVLGEASNDFVEKVCHEIGDDLGGAVFLLDIEGNEINVCTRENLLRLRQATLVIEIHDGFLDKETISNFESLCREQHFVTEIKTGPREPNAITELVGWNDADRWIVCSEGRPYPGRWLLLTPKHSG
jgi:hypothetical protein